MTTETNNNDPRVSEVYRDVSRDITPPELDRRILSMAAADERTKYWIPRVWIRPVAWAATIALSLAFVLEMSEVGDSPVPQAEPLATELLEERVMLDADAVKSKDEAAGRQRLNKRSEAPAPMKLAPPVTQPAPAEARSDLPAAGNASVSLEMEADDTSLLREAEDQARMQTGPARAVGVFAEEKEQANDCGDDARAAPESWYECVKALRDAGNSAAAQRELDLLLAEYPEFREPILDE